MELLGGLLGGDFFVDDDLPRKERFELFLIFFIESHYTATICHSTMTEHFESMLPTLRLKSALGLALQARFPHHRGVLHIESA
jgi:hypothetical protein